VARFLLTLWGDESMYTDMPEEDLGRSMKEYWELGDELQAAGVIRAGEGLEPTASARSVRVRDGRASITDGPFAETEEQLGGFYLLECGDMEEALRWAEKVPAAKDGVVEVRPVQEFPERAG
jgi:hypothetical protein